MGYAKFCCCGSNCKVSFLVTDNCNNTAVNGATVTVYTTALVVVASGVTDSSGYVEIAIPATGTYRVGALKDCAEILTGNVTLSCGLTNYSLKAWQKANLGNRTITINGTKCLGNWGSTSVTVGSDTVSTGTVFPYTGTLPTKHCGTVPVTVNGPESEFYQQSASSVTYTPTCTTQGRTVTMSLKAGWGCCTSFPSDLGIRSNKIMVTDDLGSATFATGGSGGPTICAGSWSHNIDVDYVQNSALYVNGSYSCLGFGLIPNPAPASFGTTTVSFSWSFTGGVGTCTQSTPHGCHVWKDNSPNCPPTSSWITQNSRAAAGTGSTSNPSWDATSYTINSTTFPLSVTFFWSQTGSYDPVVNTSSSTCLNTPFPAITSLTIVEMTPP